ncbi:MAG: MGMT family protein [Bacteroidales bacterium]|nr:MGMT family protein [Bacteroidales bacterium]
MNSKLSDKVYEIVSDIPRGSVMTYGQIAERLGNKNLARVVGNILHNNPTPIIVPCHRVVNSKGELAKNFGFGGIEKQKELLEAEGVVVKIKKLRTSEVQKVIYRVNI